jgi:hypothetical protein
LKFFLCLAGRIAGICKVVRTEFKRGKVSASDVKSIRKQRLPRQTGKPLTADIVRCANSRITSALTGLQN